MQLFSRRLFEHETLSIYVRVCRIVAMLPIGLQHDNKILYSQNTILYSDSLEVKPEFGKVGDFTVLLALP